MSMTSDGQSTAGLTGKLRRELRSLGHHLNPVVMVGREGVRPQLIAQVDRELDAHELIKIRVLDAAPESRGETADAIARATGAALVQVLGRTALLFRPRPDDDADAP